jgi:hypothetical protein
MTQNEPPLLPQQNIATFLATYGRHILFSLIGAAFIITLAYNFLFNQSVDDENAYLYAQVDYNNFVAAKKENLFELTKLEKILKKYKSLHTKYDPLIAQQLIYFENSSLALPYAESTLSNTKEEMHTLYGVYANNTLSITENKKEEALTQALLLKDSLNSKSTSHPVLHLLTLLRIAILKDEISKPYEAQEAWLEFEEFINTPSGKLTFSKLNEIYTEGEVTLLDYIKERKKATQ